MNRSVKACAALALLGGLMSCHKNDAAPSPSSTPTQQVVDISGTHFTLDGQPWLPQGVMIRGFIAPTGFLQSSPDLATTYTGRINYGLAELNAAKAFGADVLRFQVSQPSLDPQNLTSQNVNLYDSVYVRQTITAIKTARQNNFVVLISMQDEERSGEPTPHLMPIAETLRNWEMLTTVFGKDRGVMFELYNEPQLTTSPANWQTWAQGDASLGFVGMQTMVNDLRAKGSQNVFLLDGLGFAQTLEGVPTIADPLNRVAYAIHPYQRGSDDESRWPAQFELPSQTLPVICTEWSAVAGGQLGLRQLPSYQVAVDVLNHMRQHNIPVIAGEFDVTGMLVQTVPGWTPTNYDNYAPSPSPTGHDSGMLVHNDFLNHYSRDLTLADGL